jgi:hypothetical protein
MKRFISLLAFVLASLSVKAIHFVVNGIYYNFDFEFENDLKLATVSSPSKNYYKGNVVIPETFEYDNEIYKVTKIDEKAFYYCSDLTSVIIPNSVKSIGKEAFKRCSGLTSINIPNSVKSIGESAFSCCSGLTSLEIPYGITYLTGFDNCTSLTSITIPNNVTRIGVSAFAACKGLTSIIIPNSLTEIGANGFSGCSGLTSVNIPNSVTVIGESAFQGCSGLTSLEIPYGVKNIGRSAFANCSSLTSISFPNSLIGIGDYAFYNCLHLSRIFSEMVNPCLMHDNTFGIDTDIDKNIYGNTTVIVPKDTKSAYKSARGWKLFNNIIESSNYFMFEVDGINYKIDDDNTVSVIPMDNKYQGKLFIPQIVTYNGMTYSVSSIGSFAFYNCNDLTSITIPKSVTFIGERAFDGCSGLTSLTIPNGVASIGDKAFRGCSRLTSLTIPNSVISIGNEAFKDCGITSIIIPQSVATIGDYAFQYCKNLTTATIGNGVTKIKKGLFSGCNNLKSVAIGSRVTLVEDYSFENCPNLNSFISLNPVPPTFYYAGPHDCGNYSLAFEGTNFKFKVNLYVPLGSRDTYKKANEWSMFKSITEIVKGDLNFDGFVDNADIEQIKNYIIGNHSANVNMEFADYNDDGVVNVADIVSIIKWKAVNGKSIVGVWEATSVEYSYPNVIGLGEDMYLYADGIYKDPHYTGHWSLNGTTFTVYYDDGDKIAVHNVIKLTDTELVLQHIIDGEPSIIVHFKRRGYLSDGL